MGWVYREADQHKCSKPRLDRGVPGAGAGTRAGDVWQCDDVECRAFWVVRSDQRDGPFFDRATSTDLVARGIDPGPGDLA